jgi:CMP-N-acetylneuraminic acid synthetase
MGTTSVTDQARQNEGEVPDLKIIKDVCWGFIPARGGSKSVPLKNLAPLRGRCLLDYCIAAAHGAESTSRLICSTDSDPIAKRCAELGVEVHVRPDHLGADSTPLFDVLLHFFKHINEREGGVAEFIALLQPTSPFLLPEHVDRCVRGLRADKSAASAQTLVHCPHNHHAYNQRVVSDGKVRFRYLEERRRAYNKQSKPEHFLFGNIVVFRTRPALKQGIVFAEPSLAFEIPLLYGFDCDGPDDFKIGEALLSSQLVVLPGFVEP